MKNRTGKLQLVPQLQSIAQIAVVRQSHFPFLMIDLNRLAVIPCISSCGTVSDMAHSHGSL